MRPVDRGAAPADDAENELLFKEYGDARDWLIERVGDYCSYCEVALNSSVPVEHVLPKSRHPQLEKKWSNLLLACDYCNPVKGSQDVVLEDYFWPDCDNTARPFVYELDRSPQVASNLTAFQKEVARRTLELTGLDREPGHPGLTRKDRRWLKRREAWGVAIHEYRKIQENDSPQQRDSAVHVAISRGFWSVWMQVFAGDIDMRRRLIAGFRGTAQNCFDFRGQPIKRDGGQI